MPVRIKETDNVKGKINPPQLNEEVDVVSMLKEGLFCFVTGFVDLSAMQTSDTVELKEYFNEKSFETCLYSGVQSDPILRFVTKIMVNDYKLTLNQKSGTPREYSFEFLKSVAESF